MLLNLLPPGLRKYATMSKRLRQHELKHTLWSKPIVYITAAFFLAAVTLMLDMLTPIPDSVFPVLQSKASVTRLLVTTLIGGLLTLAAYTLNSILVVLTTFSGQFSPRMLLNFISDNRTQHVLGIFYGSFVYVLLVFLFITSYDEQMYLVVPSTTVLIGLTAAITFVYFINHASTWMQVHNITYNMMNLSTNILNNSIEKEMEPFRTEDTLYLEQESLNETKDKKTINTHESGYIQVIDFKGMIEQAQKDGITVKMEHQIGTFLLVNNPIMTYWGENSDQIDESLYLSKIEIGHKETEIQDVEQGLNKLSEIGIKALGNNDPKTTTNTIHQLSDLLLTISKLSQNPPYLVDDEQQVRMIIPEESFEFYLYKGFGYIRHYAKGNCQIITEIIRALDMIARSIDQAHYKSLWDFASNTVYGFQSLHIYELDRKYLLETLEDLAYVTSNQKEYEEIKKQIQGDIQQTANISQKSSS